MNEAIRTSEMFERYSGRRIRRKILPNLTRAAIITGGVIGAAAFHMHPEVMQSVPQFIADGANAIHLPDALNTVKNASDTVGGILDKVWTVGFIPHLIETHTPASQIINQQGLDIIEASLAAEGLLGLRKVQKQSAIEKAFKAETAEMRDIESARQNGAKALPILQKREGPTLFGNRKTVMEKVLAKPRDKWNSARIENALTSTLLTTLKAKEEKLAILKNPRIASQIAGEATEQTLRIVAKHSLGAIFGTFAGVGFWLLQHYGLTKREAKKHGEPELIKASWIQFPAAFFPIVGGILAAALSIPGEIWLRGHLDKIKKYVVAGMARDMKENPKTLQDLKGIAKRSLRDSKVRDEVEALPTTVATLNEEEQNSEEAKRINGRINEVQHTIDLGVAEYTRRQSKNALSRRLHRKRIKGLEITIGKKHEELLNLMQSTLGKESEAAQLASALQTIYSQVTPIQRG